MITKKIVYISAFSALLSSCAATKQQSMVHYTEATPIIETKEELIEIPKPVYMPNQWKKLPNKASSKKAETNPVDIINSANKDSTQVPVPEGMINSMMTYDYMEGALYQVYTAPRRITSIMLQPGEQLVSAAAGDTSRWLLSPVTSGAGETQQTHILIKPTREDLETNLFITTNKRTYNMELASNDDTYMAAIKWNYPYDMVLAKKAEIEASTNKNVTLTNVNVNQLDFNYKINGKRRYKWTPVRVYNDSAKTFIQFPRHVLVDELPVLFVEGKGGETQLVNYRVKKDYFIVDKLFESAQLRLGTKNQEIVTIEREG